MKKRLLAVLLACCMAAGMANAVFAADELPATAESAAAIAPADPDPPAPEPESEAEPTPAADPDPDIEAEPTPAADPAATPETARTLVMETLLAAPDTAAQTAVVTSAELVDSIRTDGCFTAKVNGSTDRLDGAVYTWYRSKDGTNWEEVPQQLCSGDAWNITPGSEHRLNAALDACIAGVRDAERLYYKVEVTGTDGAKLTAAAMQVPYCIQLQNGSFETPDIAGLKAYHNKNNNTPASRLYYSPDGGTGTFFTQYPSGEGGIVWQTTGVARHWQTGSAGLYIELADGSNRSYNGTRNYPEASYSIDGAYDGQQFAELNCEAYGALYQDVLTAPGTTLHWSLAHRARGRGMQDSMALLIAPVDVAAQITDILAGVSSEDDNRGLLVRAALDRTVQYNGEEVPIRSFMVGGEITEFQLRYNRTVADVEGSVTDPDGNIVESTWVQDGNLRITVTLAEPLSIPGEHAVRHTTTDVDDGDRVTAAYLFTYDPAAPPPQLEIVPDDSGFPWVLVVVGVGVVVIGLLAWQLYGSARRARKINASS